MLIGRRVNRIYWLPGSDELHGECHCGATHIDDDPADMWAWLLAHPRGHAGGPVETTVLPMTSDARGQRRPLVGASPR